MSVAQEWGVNMANTLKTLFLTFCLLWVAGSPTSSRKGSDSAALNIMYQQDAQSSSAQLKQGETTQVMAKKKPGKPGGTPGFAGDYLDVYVVKVKPEKMTDFMKIAEKFAQASRRFNGTNWLALETLYGEGDTFTFISSLSGYAEIEQANGFFQNALNKAYGKEAAEKLLRDWQNCLAESRSELRRRRLDLSLKAPTDPAAYASYIGESRVLRTTAVHVRPGHVAEFESFLRRVKGAGERETNAQPFVVSEVVEGSRGTTFYITALRSSLGSFDDDLSIRDMLGAEGENEYLRVQAESVESTQSSLLRFSPELSSPPEDVANTAADFWRPKAMVTAAAAKAKGSEAKAVTAKPKE